MVVMSIPILESEEINFEGVRLRVSRAADNGLSISIEGEGTWLLTNINQQDRYTSAHFHRQGEKSYWMGGEA